MYNSISDAFAQITLQILLYKSVTWYFITMLFNFPLGELMPILQNRSHDNNRLICFSFYLNRGVPHFHYLDNGNFSYYRISRPPEEEGD
jgi:hypothetical protein